MKRKKGKNRKGIEKKREKKKSVIPSPEKFTSPSAILQTHTHTRSSFRGSSVSCIVQSPSGRLAGNTHAGPRLRPKFNVCRLTYPNFQIFVVYFLFFFLPRRLFCSTHSRVSGVGWPAQSFSSFYFIFQSYKTFFPRPLTLAIKADYIQTVKAERPA